MFSLFITSFPINNAEAYNYSLYEERESEEEKLNDPFEGFNRVMFKINVKFYRWISSPVLEGYRKVTKKPFRTALGNFVDNLKNGFFFVNRVAQLDAKETFNVLARFGINSTAGFLGFFEVAEPLGFEKHYTDMGLTLAKYGIGGGPYLMIPLYGPTNLRDGLGNLGDFAVDPLNFNVLEIASNDSWLTNEQRWVKFALTGFIDFERAKDPLDIVLETSFDPYATIRSAYYQNRAEKLRKIKWGKEK